MCNHSNVQTLDGHHKDMARSTYWLRHPREDAALSKKLVEVVLKDTVPYPSEMALSDHSEAKLQASIEDANAELDPYDETPKDVPEVHEAEAQLDWWSGAGDFFGIPKPLPVLCQGDLLDPADIALVESEQDQVCMSLVELSSPGGLAFEAPSVQPSTAQPKQGTGEPQRHTNTPTDSSKKHKKEKKDKKEKKEKHNKDKKEKTTLKKAALKRDKEGRPRTYENKPVAMAPSLSSSSVNTSARSPRHRAAERTSKQPLFMRSFKRTRLDPAAIKFAVSKHRAWLAAQTNQDHAAPKADWLLFFFAICIATLCVDLPWLCWCLAFSFHNTATPITSYLLIL